jgi:hypothetical protein
VQYYTRFKFLANSDQGEKVTRDRVAAAAVEEEEEVTENGMSSVIEIG